MELGHDYMEMPSYALNDATKMPVIMLAGTNPERPIGDEAAKAMVNVWTGGTIEPLFIHTLRPFLNSDYVDAVWIVGPKKRLKKRLKEALIEGEIAEKIHLIKESDPGDARAIVENVKLGYAQIDSPSPLVAVACCDAPFITDAALDDIFRSQFASVRQDYDAGRLAQMYLTFGEASYEEKMDLAMRSRPPLIIGPDEKTEHLRWNFMHLANISELLPYEHLIEGFLDIRKTRSQGRATAEYLLKCAADRGLSNLERITATRLAERHEFTDDFSYIHALLTPVWKWAPAGLALDHNKRVHKFRQQSPNRVPPKYWHSRFHDLNFALNGLSFSPVVTHGEGSLGTFDIDFPEELTKAHEAAEKRRKKR